jgi:ABC-type lipoprotein release transport system permease subunit
MWRTLVLRSLRFHARSHLGSLLGVIVATAVLVGAMAVGDCVRATLYQMALNRIGRANFALIGGDRLFRSALANDLKAGLSNATAAPILELAGTAANNDDSARANHVSILGVGPEFWSLAQKPSQNPSPPPAGPGVILNEPLARQLGVKPGDTVLLHVQKPSALSLDAPISPQEEVQTGFRANVSAIVSDAQFGRFSLQANQAAPFNAFLPLEFLQTTVNEPGKANLILVAGETDAAKLKDVLRKKWTLEDANLKTREVPGGVEIGSDRVFLDPPIIDAALSLAPKDSPEEISTYFVNQIASGKKATPYSMVTAAEPPLVPQDLADDEILANQWLADDLDLKPDAEIFLTYLVPGGQRLVEKTNRFRLKGILPMSGPTADRTLMPDFPGIAKAEKTENWDAGFHIDLTKIRPKDEAYWKTNRGTPKAFVTLNAGKRMWGTRFGDITAVRFSGDKVNSATIAETLPARLDPAALGLVFQDIRRQALAASSQAEDFGGLFIGFSFFLIAAALILLGLLFQLALEKRATEIGILLAVGWRPKQVRRWLMGEGAALALVGGLVGTALGLLYARGILFGLSTLWRAAVNTSALEFHVTPETLASGCASAILVSAGVIWLALRAQTRRPARQLLEQGSEMEAIADFAKPRRRFAGIIAVASFVCALGSIGWGMGKHGEDAVEGFFSGGALLLIAGIAGAAVWFRALASKRSTELRISSLGVRTVARRPRRSLAVAALLASGSFVMIAVQLFKLDAARDARERSSGTGGFALIGESAVPVSQNLNTQEGRDFFGLDAGVLAGAQFVPMRLHEGDDASCLNMNRAQTPRLLGVDARLLDARHAFTFTATENKAAAANPWLLLTATNLAPDEVPAIGDEASITWALGKKIGDTINYTDGHGNAFKVRLVGALANSILQGSLIIDEAQFIRRYPAASGYRMFLIDCASTNSGALATALGRALQDRGMEISRATDRLNALNAVQNTYLDTFEVLGGLGLLLGSAGLGVVVLRNVLERRGELAVLEAVGFRRAALRRLILSEHTALQFLGLLLGMAAAFAAVLPALISGGSPISYGPLAATLGIVFLSGVVWIWIAARVALRGELLEALRNQ